eukprot:952223_1
MSSVRSLQATYFLLSWILIHHTTMIASECSEWTESLTNQSAWDHTISHQSTCIYTKINDELSKDPPQVLSYVGDSNETRSYTLRIKSERVCYDPRLVVEFDAFMVESIGFYIWLENIEQNDTFYQFVEYDHQLTCEGADSVSKRIVKVASSSTFTDDWIIVDDIYAVGSHPLTDKTKEIGVRIIVIPYLEYPEGINDLVDTTMLNATILINCSTALEWSFDFEDNQTIITFTVAIFVFNLLVSITICKTRWVEWNKQCLQHKDTFDELSVATRSLSQCKLLFISHDPQFRFANTWIWYIVVAFGLVGLPILLLSEGHELNSCDWHVYLYLIQGPIICIFLIDYHLCRAKWPFKSQFIQIRTAIVNKCNCFRRLNVTQTSFFPYISYAYVFLTICHAVGYRSGYCVDFYAPHMGWWNSVFLYISYALVSGFSILLPTFIMYWIGRVVLGSIMHLPFAYNQIWSVILAGMPSGLILLLWSDDHRLNRLFLPFQSLAISLYDAFTDINLILLWWGDPALFNYAVLQILFILMGQIVGAIDVYCSCGKKTLVFTDSDPSIPDHLDLNTCRGKCGFVSTALVGRVMYVWNIDSEFDALVDSETEDRPLTRNEVVMQTLKINEMVWESIFSVALQLYISTTYNQFNQTVLFSLATSFLNVTDSLHNFVENDKKKVKSMRAEGWVNWSAWLFIVSDFLYRILPNIALSVFVDKHYNQHYGYGLAPTYACMAVLLCLNLLMEYVVLIGYDFQWYRIRHCILSLVSSSYLLFGALNTNGVVKIDNYTFKMVIKENNWRIIFSGFVMVVCFLWQVVIAVGNWIPNEDRIIYPELIGLLVFEVFFVVINIKMRSMFDDIVIQPNHKEVVAQQVEIVETTQTVQEQDAHDAIGRTDIVELDKVQKIN